MVCILVTSQIVDEGENSAEKSMEEKLLEKRKLIASRRQARLIAVIAMYNMAITADTSKLKELVVDIISNWQSNKYGIPRPKDSQIDKPYMLQLINEALASRDLIDANITEFAARENAIARLPAVVLSILRIAITEVMLKKVDTAVVIDEYLTIAESFGHLEEKPFIHTIIDKVSRKYN